VINALRSILFASLFYPGTVVAVLMAIFASLFGRRHLRAVTKGWVLYHRWLATTILGIRTRIEGPKPVGPVLIAAKHQSMFETLEMVAILNEPAVVMKRELADIPAFGWVTRTYGIIPVDRDGGAASLRRLMRAAEEAVAEGRPIVIFPEGTRVPPGEQPPLQPGFAGLYRALRLPVVPLALDSGRLWPRRGWKRPGIVTMRFGQPIPPGLKREAIEAAVHREINVLETAHGS
jgi:1-acyl-sn-glycerol-3-phosphate acyltransferase